MLSRILDWWAIQLSAWFRVDYHTYLQTRKWKLKRQKALRIAGYQCQICICKSNLHVHHNTYIRLGFERQKDLIVVCAKCHRVIHTYLHPGRRIVQMESQREIIVNQRYGLKL